MSIEIEPEKAQDAAGQGPAVPGRARPWWMRPAIHTALIGAVLGYVVGHWLGNFLSSSYARNALSDTNHLPISGPALVDAARDPHRPDRCRARLRGWSLARQLPVQQLRPQRAV